MDAPAQWDVLVVGGGINGAGIARDAAGRALRVLLCEQDDLAAHTSSASTKLIHGGLRYLEYREFGLVRKALQEREVLLRAAPHIIAPLRFVMPHVPGLRPAWMIRAGLFLYDHLSHRTILPGSRGIDLRRHAAGAPLTGDIRRGFVYSDARVDDARLVVLNALGAQQRGAEILTRTRLVEARDTRGTWRAVLQDADGARRTVEARALVNAAGPWVGELLRGPIGRPAQHHVRLVKGSHIVTHRLFEHDHAYIFQNPDKRIVFAIPYEGEFTLIGTTDVEYHGDPSEVAISDDETAYLCETINRYFARPITPSDVVWSYAGVRPLLEEAGVDNPSAATRDYRLDLDVSGAPLLSVFGGKITTYRRLAEEALDLLAHPLGIAAPSWTATVPLPGGDVPDADIARFAAALHDRHPWLPAKLAQRYAHAYGTRAHALLDGAAALDALGDQLAPGLYEAEARYLMTHEWARSADDILWRRTKLGLHATSADARRVDEWLARQREMAATVSA